MIIICEGCGIAFEGNGHRKLCNDCRAQRQAQRNKEWRDNAKKDYRIRTCKYCGSRVGISDMCSNCRAKWELWGKIITMVQRAKGEIENDR